MNKRLFLVALVALSVILSACAQEEANSIASNEDGKLVNLSTAVGDETSPTTDERCQLKAVPRRMGDENKIEFLAEIRPGCVEAGMLSLWNDTWDKYVEDMTWADYRYQIATQ